MIGVHKPTMRWYSAILTSMSFFFLDTTRRGLICFYKAPQYVVVGRVCN
jgi:hypothetical protein